MIKKSVAGGIILLFLISSLIPITSSYEANKVYTIHIDENGTLSGYVKDTSMSPIEGARVRVYFHETYEENYTDSSGYYHVTNIPICNCTKNATVSKKGYRSECVLLSIDETTIHNFVLTRLSNTLYVGGNGPGNYSRIQDAIDNASDGDTVFVYAGTYYENVVINKVIDLIGEDRNTTIIDGKRHKIILYIQSDGVTVRGFTIQNSSSDSYWAIDIHSNKNNIDGNNIINNFDGIWITREKSNNIIQNNNISSNNNRGINLYFYCSNTIIQNNIISNNRYGGIYLHHDTKNNIIRDNYIYSNSCIYGGFGIHLDSSNENTISGNTILDHKCNPYWDTGYGIWFYGIYNNYNKIYHNNFFDNDVNARASGDNTWDNGYLSGGNYWDDYEGIDGDGDGIGDTLYDIPGGNKDRHPLMTAWGIENEPPNKPTIDGPIYGKPREEQDYTFSVTDPDTDFIYFYIDWSDGTDTGWIGPYDSGEGVHLKHAWLLQGTYTIKAKAKDIYGDESDWTTLEVSMPKNKASNTPFIRFLENHPYMFPILRQLLRL